MAAEAKAWSFKDGKFSLERQRLEHQEILAQARWNAWLGTEKEGVEKRAEELESARIRM